MAPKFPAGPSKHQTQNVPQTSVDNTFTAETESEQDVMPPLRWGEFRDRTVPQAHTQTPRPHAVAEFGRS